VDKREYRRLQKANSRAKQSAEERAAAKAKIHAQKASATSEQLSREQMARALRTARRRVYTHSYGLIGRMGQYRPLAAQENHHQQKNLKGDTIPDGWCDVQNHVTHDGVLIPADEVWQRCTKRMALGTNVSAAWAYGTTELKSICKPSLAYKTTFEHAYKAALGEAPNQRDLRVLGIETNQSPSTTCFTKECDTEL